MTREEKLWSMTAKTLQDVGAKAGVKITNSDIKKGKAVIIEKILAAEGQTEESKLVPMPGTTDPDWGKKHYVSEDVASDGTPLAEVGKEIAEQAKQKAAEVKKPERKRGALIEYNGKSQNICAWAKELGVSANTLYSRIYILGWDVEKAFTHKGKKS